MMLIQQWDHLMADLAKCQQYTWIVCTFDEIWFGIIANILKLTPPNFWLVHFWQSVVYFSFLQRCVFTVDKYWNPCKSELIIYFRNPLLKYLVVKHWLSVHVINFNNLVLTLTSSVQQRNCSHTNPEILLKGYCETDTILLNVLYHIIKRWEFEVKIVMLWVLEFVTFWCYILHVFVFMRLTCGNNDFLGLHGNSVCVMFQFRSTRRGICFIHTFCLTNFFNTFIVWR